MVKKLFLYLFKHQRLSLASQDSLPVGVRQLESIIRLCEVGEEQEEAEKEKRGGSSSSLLSSLLSSSTSSTDSCLEISEASLGRRKERSSVHQMKRISEPTQSIQIKEMSMRTGDTRTPLRGVHTPGTHQVAFICDTKQKEFDTINSIFH